MTESSVSRLFLSSLAKLAIASATMPQAAATAGEGDHSCQECRAYGARDRRYLRPEHLRDQLVSH
jgi:hypothetical protein